MEGLDGALPRPGPSSQCNDESVVIACAPSITGPDVPMHCLPGDGGKPPSRARERGGCTCASLKRGTSQSAVYPICRDVLRDPTSRGRICPARGRIHPYGGRSRIPTSRSETRPYRVKRILHGGKPVRTAVKLIRTRQYKFVPGQIHSCEGKLGSAPGNLGLDPAEIIFPSYLFCRRGASADPRSRLFSSAERMRAASCRPFIS